jgi:hypothetical protein
MFCGKLNTPPPIIEPTTRAVKDRKPSLPGAFAVLAGVTVMWVVLLMIDLPSLRCDETNFVDTLSFVDGH